MHTTIIKRYALAFGNTMNHRFQNFNQKLHISSLCLGTISTPLISAACNIFYSYHGTSNWYLETINKYTSSSSSSAPDNDSSHRLLHQSIAKRNISSLTQATFPSKPHCVVFFRSISSIQVESHQFLFPLQILVALYYASSYNPSSFAFTYHSVQIFLFCCL